MMNLDRLGIRVPLNYELRVGDALLTHVLTIGALVTRKAGFER